VVQRRPVEVASAHADEPEQLVGPCLGLAHRIPHLLGSPQGGSQDLLGPVEHPPVPQPRSESEAGGDESRHVANPFERGDRLLGPTHRHPAFAGVGRKVGPGGERPRLQLVRHTRVTSVEESLQHAGRPTRARRARATAATPRSATPPTRTRPSTDRRAAATEAQGRAGGCRQLTWMASGSPAPRRHVRWIVIGFVSLPCWPCSPSSR